MTKVLDLQRPYQGLGQSDDPDYVLQDGVILGWSESNCRYEEVWWLTKDGLPIEVPPHRQAHIDALMEERPFDPAWLG